MSGPVIVSNLSVVIGKQKILSDISLRVRAGKITGLLGPSGAGKTTLIRSIVGRQRINGGSVSIFGLSAGAPELRQRIGYMTQSPSIYPDLTVIENLRYFAAMHGLAKNAADEVLAQVELGPQRRQLASTLSGGQRSRVSLAIALLGSPELLLLDEPTVGVDPVLRGQLWVAFRGMAAAGKTLIVSSHVMDEADHCDELVLVREGRVVAQASPDELRGQTHTGTIEQSFLKLVRPDT